MKAVLQDWEQIPRELSIVSRWVVWKWELRDGKHTKPPYCARTGALASSTDPTTWCTFAEALTAYRDGPYDGLGLVVTKEDTLLGIDLDHCVNADTGTVEAWAQAIVNQMNTYTEISPSGTGLRLWAFGTLPPGGRKKGPIEMYEQGRYLTVTGRKLGGIATVQTRHREVAALHAEVFPVVVPGNGNGSRPIPVELADETLLEKMFAATNGPKIRALWAGDWTAHPSQSEADMALCHHLAFWCGRDEARMDSLFRQSGLMRDKWDTRRGRSTYGQETIIQACARCTETYGPRRSDAPLGRRDHLGRTPSDSSPREETIVTATSEEAATRIDPWPQLDELAMRGVIGDLVRAIEPHSEADTGALLVQGLIAFGNTLNRSAYFQAEADRHYMNVFAVMVGETSKGRKGTSWGQIRRTFEAVDPDWTSTRVLNGLSSGEGLIWAVRDEILKDEPIREKNRPTGEYQTVVIDRGILDKRLLVLESEFAGTLRVMSRDGNTLSVLIRQAWDSGSLRTMTKNSPAQATGAHVSIVGHVTKEELCRLIEATDASNGFLNRFLWVCVRRSKALPEGGRFNDTALIPLVQRLHKAVQFGRSAGELTRDQGARKIWCDVYPDLSEGKPGLLGAVLSRAEAQVMRLACLYALQDLSSVVTQDHLTAALALWEYCEASARYIFGQRLGDPIADELLSALHKHSAGMTRTEIRDWFGRHRKTFEIERGLSLLLKQGLARKAEEHTGGRPVERWFAVTGPTT